MKPRKAVWTDSRGRVSLGIEAADRPFLITIADDGAIILEPAVIVARPKGFNAPR